MIYHLFKKEGKVVSDKGKLHLCIRTEVKPYFEFLEIFELVLKVCVTLPLLNFFLEFLAIKDGDITGSVPLGPGRKRQLEG